MKNGTMPESQEESANPFPNMQAELHKKGAVLTKAWADLFSYLTRYQADLMVKENAVDIAEKEVDTRKKQLEEMKSTALDSEEFVKLQDGMQEKERILMKLQSEHLVTETQLKQVQSDLANHMELLEKSRSELLEKHSEVIRNRSDVDRLKSEIAVKDEQLELKDDILKKFQLQLMRENAELKEQAELDRRALLLERRAHDITRRALEERTKPGSSMTSAGTELPRSPTGLDLSVEQEDVRNQSVEQDCHIMSSTQIDLPSSSGLGETVNFSRSETTILHNPYQTLWGNRPPKSKRFRPNNPIETNTVLSQPVFPKQEPIDQSHSSSPDHADQKEVFFPLSVSDDIKNSMDTSGTDIDMRSSGRPGSGMSGSPEMNDSQIGLGAVADSQPSGSLSQDSGGESKLFFQKNVNVTRTPAGQQIWSCKLCRQKCARKYNMTVHMRLHTGEKPYLCRMCNMTFTQAGTLKYHRFKVHNPNASDG